MEVAPKDRWYDAYIGSLSDKTQLVRGCKIDRGCAAGAEENHYAGALRGEPRRDYGAGAAARVPGVLRPDPSGD